MSKKIKVIFSGYRSWAIDVINRVKLHRDIDKFLICEDLDVLNTIDLKKYDLLITVGLSDELGEICEKIETIGVHCAELDRYSYGTPIQLQIIDNITVTKHRIFKFVNPEAPIVRAHTHTREYSHEVNLPLNGDIETIFKKLSDTAVTLFNSYIDDYPKIEWKRWPEETIVRKARIPSDSNAINILKINNSKSTKDLYNFIRCLGDPYPNAYLEDDFGIVKFKSVEYISKKDSK